MRFAPGQFFAAELPRPCASDAAARQHAIGAVRRAFMASETFAKAGEPAMLVVMVPDAARDEAMRRIRVALEADA